jgi:NitT/TauT family transport system ATP-binding protein
MNISIQSLTHKYKLNSDSLLALQEINLNISSGEFVTLIGPSGCGKSTLLRILANLLIPSQGSVMMDGQSPEEVRMAKHIGWLAQNPALLPWKTVQDNITLAQKINPQSNRPTISTNELIAKVGLMEFSEVYPATLSGGMQQRVALARTLALGAGIWLMDEPFAALDELTRESLISEVISLWQEFHPTVLWVTHHIYEAVRLADRVLIMSPRPGYIHTQIEIPQPRPRDESDPKIQELIQSIRNSLSGPDADKPIDPTFIEASLYIQ